MVKSSPETHIRNFKVKGNHPIGMYIDWVAIGLDQLNCMVSELADAGYEITVEPMGRYRVIDGGSKPAVRKVFEQEGIKFQHPVRDRSTT